MNDGEAETGRGGRGSRGGGETTEIGEWRGRGVEPDSASCKYSDAV